MRRASTEIESAIGHDSFLDVVANIVGILIILVLVAGIRARRAPVAAAPTESAATQAAVVALEKDDATRKQLYGEVVRTAQEMENIQREALTRRMERNRLATVVAAMEHDLQVRRGELDAHAQERFDLNRNLAEGQRQLDQLQQQLQLTASAAPESAVVESYPTPLSKPVEDHEVHMQLRGGHIVIIPLDDLVERFRLDARRNLYKMFDVPELTETIGPVEGFRMRYTLERQETKGDPRRGPGSTYARLKEWTLLPQSPQMGETVDEALKDGSNFRQALSKLHPGRTTVTLWTYPDSFDDYRRVKKELYQLGFATAGRPLPQDRLISGAPDGSKSAAE